MPYKKQIILLSIALIFVLLLVGVVFFDFGKRTVKLIPAAALSQLESLTNAETAATTSPSTSSGTNTNSDIENQKPLPNPPEIIKAIYLTSWSAGTTKKIDYAIDLAKQKKINAVVIDIKDFSGTVTYDIQLPEIETYKTKEIRIPKINSLIKKLHDENIYVIARQAIFQDYILAHARPDLAVHDKNKLTTDDQQSRRQVGTPTESSGLTAKTVWEDRKGLSWVDPTAKEVWDYNIKIAQDAASRGFDEINFDYIRFPSDGILSSMSYSHYNETFPKQDILRDFFQYLHANLKETKISADLFGLATVQKDDLGIGQIIEDAYLNFDFVSPMVYPSHYAIGTLGYKNPGAHPYEIIKFSMESALKKLNMLKNQENPPRLTKLRPWIQDFDLGAIYNESMIKAEINAVKDSLGNDYAGFMVWSPSNRYRDSALSDN